MGKSACFTGPRPKKLYGYCAPGAYKQLIHQKIIPVVERLIQKGFDTFYSGGAQGFDQCAFWAVNELKQKYPHIKNYVIIPCHDYEALWADTGLFSKEQFHSMLSLADNVTYVTQGVFTKECLPLRNHVMSDMSDIGIALYEDDSWIDKTLHSGTAECMRYLQKTKKPILQIRDADVKWIMPQKQPKNEKFLSPLGKAMLDYQALLGKAHRYIPMKEETAKRNYQIYYRNLPEEYRTSSLVDAAPIPQKGYVFPGKEMPIFNRNGELLSRKYDRLVIGQYGAFIEIDDADFIKDNIKVKEGQEYRIYDDKYKNNVKYQWYTTKDDTNCKLYYQQKEVAYADYKPEKWYISPYETEYRRDILSHPIDLFGVENGIICQQVNCQNMMAAGLAKAIAEEFPEVKEYYHENAKTHIGNQFGTYEIIPLLIPDFPLSVANIYSQDKYGNPTHTKEIFTDIDKLVRAIKEIALTHPDTAVYVPYNIGCGYGGESWEHVFSALDDMVRENHLTNVRILDTLSKEVSNPFVDHIEYDR